VTPSVSRQGVDGSGGCVLLAGSEWSAPAPAWRAGPRAISPPARRLPIACAENGTTLYCRKRAAPATRVGTRTTCLTAEELKRMEDAGRDAITAVQVPGYQGHP
jgi:hypothetical protein